MGLAPVTIRGWGSVCALGVDTATSLAALRAGHRGLAPPARSPHLVSMGGRMVWVGEVPFDPVLEDRARAMVRVAVDEALAMVGPASGTTGVFVGTTGGFFVDAEVDLHRARAKDPEAMPRFGRRGPGEVAEAVARQTGASGPTLTFSMACTSSAAALVAAATHLRAGTCDRAWVVGFDALSSLTLYGFRSLLLCDPNPCRPFDRRRAGLQLGEGCGALVLERGSGGFEVLGADNGIDTANLTASATDGSTVERVIRRALAASDVAPENIATIKAHGTGTIDNDLAEGRGIARVFGPRPPAFASLKGSLGHTLGAAGALETVLWLAALRAGFVPGSIGFEEGDPDIGVSPTRESSEARVGAHLLHAFGFGGSCVAAVIRDG